MLRANEGNVDRGLRIVAGLGMLGAGAFFANPLGLIGLVPLVTGLTGRCLLYYPFKISTKKK